MRRKMLPEEKELRNLVGYANVDASVEDMVKDALAARKLIRALIRAAYEDAAKACDAQAAFYKALKKKGSGWLVDADIARVMAAEDCAAAIRARR